MCGQLGALQNTEVIREKLDHLWIGTRLFAFDDWKEIQKMFEIYFKKKTFINPVFEENVLHSQETFLTL